MSLIVGSHTVFGKRKHTKMIEFSHRLQRKLKPSEINSCAKETR